MYFLSLPWVQSVRCHFKIAPSGQEVEVSSPPAVHATVCCADCINCP